MRRAVVADLHIGQRSDDLERFRTTTAELCAGGAGEVVFLGDLFRTLVGYSRFWDATVRAGLAGLAALRRAGLRVVLVEGNRDFFLDARELDPFRDAAGPVSSFSAGGRRFMLEHGDLVNRRDRAYHFWRGVSKSATARVLARLLPMVLAQRIVRRTEARLSRTNFSYRRELPEDDLRAHARRHFATGVDVVLWGHFHRSWRFEQDGRLAWTVPAWAETGAVVWIGEDGALSVRELVEGAHFVDTTAASWYQEAKSLVKAR